jgi:hypothetical protein
MSACTKTTEEEEEEEEETDGKRQINKLRYTNVRGREKARRIFFSFSFVCLLSHSDA